MRLAWLTDIHLNFLDLERRRQFAADVARTEVDGVVVTGDIAEAESFAPMLVELADIVAQPVWFVLGNHDYYRGTIAEVRAQARALSAHAGAPRWLPACRAIRLSDSAALVGHDGWGDARLGDVEGTTVQISDFFLIADLAELSRPARRDRLRALGDDEARALAASLDQAMAWARHVLVATHVPPFREACWHEGALSNDEWLPWFTCAATGQVLRAAAEARPDVAITVLCGHTHGAGRVELLPNLRVVTGGAEYGEPAVQGVVIVDDAGIRVAAR